MLAKARIDDLTEEVDPVNVPANSTEHPNWGRLLSLTLDELAESELFGEIVGIFSRSRRDV
jgi:4-alpha-glucanotransferase